MSATHPLKPFETAFGSSEAHCFYSGTKYRWECLSAFERFGFLNYESSMTTFYLYFLIFKAWREWGRENDCSLTTRPRAAALEAHRERGNLDRTGLSLPKMKTQRSLSPEWESGPDCILFPYQFPSEIFLKGSLWKLHMRKVPTGERWRTHTANVKLSWTKFSRLRHPAAFSIQTNLLTDPRKKMKKNI